MEHRNPDISKRFIGLIDNSLTVLKKMQDHVHKQHGSYLLPDKFGPYKQQEYPNVNYGHDACRVPLRLARFLEFMHNSASSELKNKLSGESDLAKTVLQRLLHTLLAHRNNDGLLYDTYKLDGKPAQQGQGGPQFNGPVMVALNVLIKLGGGCLGGGKDKVSKCA